MKLTERATRTLTLPPAYSSGQTSHVWSNTLSELTQPKYRSNPTTGKIEIDKRGDDEAKKSPDSYDATALAFARDCDYLRARL